MTKTQFFFRLILPVLLIVFGAKMLLIEHFGAMVPFGDQWDGEAGVLYKPFLDGNLTWQILLVPHNEHRILMTRLLNLGMLGAFGGWLPQLQMVVNAGLHVALISGLLLALMSDLKIRLISFAGLAAIAILFSLPIAWENTIWGFQSQFYLVVGFSLMSVWLLGMSRPLSPAWFGGLVLAICAYFSMATGMAALVAALVVASARVVSRHQRFNLSFAVSLALIVTVLVAEYLWVPSLLGQEELKAHSIGQFLIVFVTLASWPLPAPFGLLLYLPLPWFAWRIFRKPDTVSKSDWGLLCCVTWLAVQWAVIAYARADGPYSSRYMDIMILGPVLAIISWLRLRWAWPDAGKTRAVIPIVTAMALACAGAVILSVPAFDAARNRHEQLLRQTANVQDYIETGDPAVLQKPFPEEIPFPDPNYLASMIDDTTVRAIMPPELTGQALPDRVLLPSRATWLFRASAISAMKAGLLWIGLGIGLALAGWRRAARRTDGPEA